MLVVTFKTPLSVRTLAALGGQLDLCVLLLDKAAAAATPILVACTPGPTNKYLGQVPSQASMRSHTRGGVRRAGTDLKSWRLKPS